MKALMAGAVLLGIAAALVGCSAADNKSGTPSQASVAGSANRWPPPRARRRRSAPARLWRLHPRPQPGAPPPTSVVHSKCFRRSTTAKPPLTTSRAWAARCRLPRPTCGSTHQPKIATAAITYATVMEGIGKAIASGSVDESHS